MNISLSNTEKQKKCKRNLICETGCWVQSSMVSGLELDPYHFNNIPACCHRWV